MNKTACAITMAIVALWTSAASSNAAEVPDFMKVCVVNEGAPPSKSKTAFDNIYALNDGMFSIYDKSQAIFQKNFKERNPLILGLFSGKGGRFILYRPGQPPLEADPVPAVYRMAKSTGHSAMAVYDCLAPYCADSNADPSWRGELKAYRTRVGTALDTLDDADLKPEDKEAIKVVLKKVVAFSDDCLAKGFTEQDLETYGHGIKPDLAKLIGIASSNQVGHWYKVLEDWKKLLGKDWDHTYAVSNSIYVARQNNIIFSTLVQFFGQEAINDRLILLETTDFTASPDDMVAAFIRIMGDRALGQVFFKNYRLMDYELLGWGGRKAIEAEAAKRGQKAILPPLVPINSHAWPFKTDVASGDGPSSMDDIK